MRLSIMSKESTDEKNTSNYFNHTIDSLKAPEKSNGVVPTDWLYNNSIHWVETIEPAAGAKIR